MTADRLKVMNGRPPPGKLRSLQVHENVHFEGDQVRKHSSKMRVERELEAIEFVRSNTSIPLPTIISTQISDVESWFLMSRVPGVTLEEGWNSMTEEAQSITIGELKAYLQQLRQLKPFDEIKGCIGSVSGGAVYDHRLNNGFACGPFESVAQFNNYLCAPVRRCPKPELEAHYRQKLRDNMEVIFAHADLSTENIMVDPSTGKVTAILDWEMAGFWPEWWEFRKALAGGRNDGGWWPQVVRKVMPAFDAEWIVDYDLECFGSRCRHHEQKLVASKLMKWLVVDCPTPKDAAEAFREASILAAQLGQDHDRQLIRGGKY